jgi:aryl-alcohol dehydrogenase-like predicted oxidoreductase
MQKRRLGDSALEITPLAFGGNIFGWTVDEAASFRLLDHFVDAGFNLIDTADVYSHWAPGNQGGESETIIGRWLRASGKRARVLIATKVGMDMGPAAIGKGLGADHIARSIEASLRRLQTDYVDLYQAHEDDPKTPQEETLAAFARLIQAGKVRAIGASNFPAARLASALALSRRLGLPRYESLQPQYNLYDRAGFEEALEPLCLRENVGVITYYSLARGFLTGKYRSAADLGKSTRGPGCAKYLNPRGFAILAALDDVADRLGSTPGRVALAWSLARPSVTAPIASGITVEQVDDLVAATELHLDAASIAQLTDASRY